MTDTPRSHTGFAVYNRTVNPLIGTVLRSPAHGLISGHLLLITVTGRRTGRVFTFPVAYSQEGDRVTIGVGWPERKRWWRNLRDGGRVDLVLRGKRRSGAGRAHGDERSSVRVEVDLDPAASR